jgi:hypothetical protein
MANAMNNLLNKIGRGVPNLVIAQRVLDKMVAAASRYLADETGEAMVGLIVPGAHTNGVPTIYVLDTIPPLDDNVVREWGTFQQGEELQEEQFWWLVDNWQMSRDKKRTLDGKPLSAKWDVPLIHVGDWHKQPGFMIQPSQGDLFTARHMVSEGEGGLEFLVAPIVTLGHPATTDTTPQSNHLTIPQGDTCMRVDFWYLDRNIRDFHPIRPTVYPSEQLPSLPGYPWHIVDETRYKAEYALFEQGGLLASAPVLWDVHENTPLDICFVVVRPGWKHILLLVTPADYPKSAPSARLAPYVDIASDDNIVEIFEDAWEDSEPIPDPADWKWAEGRHLIDYVFALEEALADKLGKKPSPPAPPLERQGEGSKSEAAADAEVTAPEETP